MVQYDGPIPVDGICCGDLWIDMIYEKSYSQIPIFQNEIPRYPMVWSILYGNIPLWSSQTTSF